VRAMHVRFALFAVDVVPGRWHGHRPDAGSEAWRWVTEHQRYERISEWVSPTGDEVVFQVPGDPKVHTVPLRLVIGMFPVDGDDPLRWTSVVSSVTAGMTVKVSASDVVTSR
jgi:hypothetical protein